MSALASVASIVRVLVVIALTEARTVTVSPVFMRTAAILGAIIAVQAGLVGLNAWRHGAFLLPDIAVRSLEMPHVPLRVWPAFTGYLSANWAATFMPLALFLASCRRRPHIPGAVPILGLAVVSLVVGLCLVGWVAPVATAHYRDLALQAVSENAGFAGEVPTLTLPGLIRRVWTVPQGLGAFRWLSLLGRTSALIIAGPTLLLLACVVRSMSIRWWRVWAVCVSAGYVWVFGLDGVLGPVVTRHSLYWQLFAPPAVPTLAVLAWLTIAASGGPSPPICRGADVALAESGWRDLHR